MNKIAGSRDTPGAEHCHFALHGDTGSDRFPGAAGYGENRALAIGSTISQVESPELSNQVTEYQCVMTIIPVKIHQCRDRWRRFGDRP